MTMVQWWCTGVMLDRIFHTPKAFRGWTPADPPTGVQNKAADTRQNSAATNTGKTLDCTA